MIAEDGSTAAVAYFAPQRMTDGTWNLLTLLVNPDQQGRGHGGAVVEHVEDVLRKQLETSTPPPWHTAAKRACCRARPRPGHRRAARRGPPHARGPRPPVSRRPDGANASPAPRDGTPERVVGSSCSRPFRALSRIMTPAMPPGDDYSLCIDPVGVIHLRWTEGLYIDEQIARSAIRSVDELNGLEHRPLQVRIIGTAGITRQARIAFSEPCSVSRVALLGRSPVEGVMANFILRVKAPAVPTRYFTSEVEARRWLLDRATAG